MAWKSLEELVSGGSADPQPQQKSSFTGGAARPSLEKWLCSSYPPGALVIASTTGTELAYESAALQNGVFTHALINGLRMASTDLNSDGVISVSELREMVATNVAQLTAGRQRPVARREGIDFDLAVARPTSSAAPGSL